MTPLRLPAAVEAVFNAFLTCEFTTIGKAGGPVAWPTLPIYWPERGQFVIASAVALAQKAANIRRNPRVSLLYSNATGSGLKHPPAVLVQGQAVAPEQVVVDGSSLDPQLMQHLSRQGQRLLGSQPGIRLYLANPLTRYVMEWYFIRVFMYVTPRRITWWDSGDFEREPHSLEVDDVATDRALPA
jgi:hypothetical protein